jgi:glucose/arabinose dehydrogenase
MGDGGSAGDPGNRAQNLSIRLGKLLRANPYVRRPAWRVIGYGLRNPWRFSFDSATGDMYVGDVGQGTWEEVDFRARSNVSALANYGWNVFEGRARFRPGTPNGAGELVSPVAVYDHAQGCSITGGYVYRGHTVPSAVGRYFYGDWCSGSLWSLRIAGGGAETRREPGSIPRLTTFGVDDAGELYAGTGTGRIVKLRP